ncbi:DUF2332 domain-containing protein [Altererythrobacter lutimaris]|nr:DUF2332 domain-containing protein [Altererythrobacter lutimaris]
MSNDGVMFTRELAEAINWQAQHAEENGAPCTARLIRAIPKVAQSETANGRRIANWEGITLKDAMPLRFTGGLHHLVLTGEDTRLERVYSGQITDQDTITRMVCELVETFDTQLLPWLDGPPQTNEAGRSASIMAGLLWLSGRVGSKFELNELGASAGVNTMMERYHYDLGGTRVGSKTSPMQIAPEWRGDAPPANPVEIVSIKGCDQATIDLSDPAAALKLKAYVWPDATVRMSRIDAAIALANEQPPKLVQQDASDFVESFLALDHLQGVTRTMFHSIMWQYMPAETQDAISRVFEEAAANASPERPFAWIALETDPATFRHELKVRYWNGSSQDGETHLLSHAHPHGAWVEWIGAD